MAENVGIRLTGGPLATTNIYSLDWPPPDRILAFSHHVTTSGTIAVASLDALDNIPDDATIGIYRKVRQSQLEAGALPPVVVRGAEYEWEPPVP